MKKYEWRKADKNIYLPKDSVQELESIKFNYITISGVGNPNQEDFSSKIQVLYSLAYAIRMSYKGDWKIPGFYLFTVFPLEGIWTSQNQNYEDIKRDGLDKDDLKYKLMLRQPDFVSEQVFDKALARVKAKDLKFIEMAKFEEIQEAPSVQIIHNGSYDSEIKSFKLLEDYIEENQLQRIDAAYHKEIYLRMDRKDSSRNQTTLRMYVESKL